MGTRIPLAVLFLVYGAVLAAGFLAPYDQAAQHRDLPFAPPARLRFADAGGWHPRPFVYRQVEVAGRFGEYEEDRSERFPIRFLVDDGESTRLFGVAEPSDARPYPPPALFLLGGDRFGRDLFSRWLHGGRISLFAGLLAGLLSVGLGLVLGAAAGLRGGAVDEVVMRAAELFLALPWLYLLIGLRAFLPLELSPPQAFLMLVGVLGLLGWAGPARLVRGAVLSLRERDFVRAARGFGASDLYLLRRHVLPQTWGLVLTQLTVLVPRFILAEVTLSFLGLGIAEPAASWGTLLADLREISVTVSHPWMTAPVLVLVAVILSYHQLAHALQRQLGILQL